MCGTYRHGEGDDLLHLLDSLSDIHKHMEVYNMWNIYRFNMVHLKYLKLGIFIYFYILHSLIPLIYDFTTSDKLFELEFCLIKP